MSKKAYIIIGIIILTITVWLIFFRSSTITNYPSKGTNVIAFGDSLVKGIGSSEGNDFVSLLTKEININIINAGVSGDTTSTALDRLENDVLSKDPKVVIVLLGGNDYLRKVDKKLTFDNLQKIVDQIHQKGAIVLLLGVRGGLLRDTYKSDFDDFAKRNKVAYVENVLDNVLGDSTLMSDQIHPNDKGYMIIANKISPILKSVIN